MTHNDKLVLSRNLLEMKFMQRTKERYEKETKDEDGRSLFNSDLIEQMKKSEGKFFTEHSFISCANLAFGRRSYRQFNPEIEKLMEDFNGPKDEQTKKNEGISDKDFANRYSTLMGTIAKKFSKKRPHPNPNKIGSGKADKRTDNQTKNSNINKNKRKKAADFWKPTNN